MNNSLTKITYETSLGTVDLDFQTVKNYLVRGQSDKITDQEVILFIWRTRPPESRIRAAVVGAAMSSRAKQRPSGMAGDG